MSPGSCEAAGSAGDGVQVQGAYHAEVPVSADRIETVGPEASGRGTSCETSLVGDMTSAGAGWVSTSVGGWT